MVYLYQSSMRYTRFFIIFCLVAVIAGGVYWFVFLRHADTPTQDVTLTASDGVSIASTYYPGSKNAGVILIPGIGDARSTLDRFARMLQQKNLTVLTIDVRPSNGENVPSDIESAKAFLHAQSSNMRIGLIGGDFGANAAIINAVQYGGVHALATVSPTINDHGLLVTEAFTQYDGPLYVLDQYVNPDADQFHGRGLEPIIVEQGGDLFISATTSDKQWFQVEGSARGWDLVTEDSQVEKILLEFCTKKLL